MEFLLRTFVNPVRTGASRPVDGSITLPSTISVCTADRSRRRSHGVKFKTLVAIFAGIFFFAAMFSITFGMQTDEHGNMSGCPFMSKQSSVCLMGAIEHITKWQQFFTAIFSQSNTFVSSILLSLFLIFLSLFIHAPIILPISILSPPIPTNTPETKLFNHLMAAFSHGILNPKIY